MKILNKIVYYLCIVLAILTIMLLLTTLGKMIDSRCLGYESEIVSY